MKKGVIVQMFNSLLGEAGNDAKKAGIMLAKKIEGFLSSPDSDKNHLESKDFNFAQLAHELIPNLEDYRGDPDAVNVTNAVRSSQFPTISKVVIHNEILKAYQLYQEGLDDLVSEGNAQRTTEDTIAGFTEQESLEMRLEGMAYEETNFGEKDISVRMADFGRMISITREALYNDRTGQLLNNAKKVGEKGGQHRGKMIVQTIECLPRTAFKEATGGSKAFVYKGTAYQYSDFYNASTHVTIDGRVNANLKTSNPLGNYTNIQASLSLFDKMKDSQGDEIVIVPNTILVPSELEVAAFQILNTASYVPVGPTTTGLTESGNLIPVHTANPYGQGGLASFKVKKSRYMSSTSTWYMGDFANQLIWLWVYKPATAALAASAEKAFTNNIVLTYKFSYHGGCGHSDYVNIAKNTA
jgi:hypothetical protein